MICTRLFEVYELMTKHVAFVGGGTSFCNVNQSFGKKALESVASYPHIVWVPTSDSYGPARLKDYPSIESGKRVYIDGIRTRVAGCDLHIFHQTHHDVEELLNDVHLALYDIMIAEGAVSDPGDFSVGGGAWDENASVIANNSVKYIQSITCQFPVYRLLPAQLAETIKVNLPQ